MDEVTNDLLRECLQTPAAVAVVVVDMQRDFCDPEGQFARAGLDIERNRSVVAPTAAFVDRLRDAGAQIVWIRQGSVPATTSPAIERRLRRVPAFASMCQSGTVGAQLAVGLEVAAGDVEIEKFRYSAFVGSQLDLVLRSNGISTVVVTGTAANACVDSTTRDAAQLDYDVVVVRDLVGWTQSHLAEASLENLERHFAYLADADEVVAALDVAVPASMA